MIQQGLQYPGNDNSSTLKACDQITLLAAKKLIRNGFLLKYNAKCKEHQDNNL